MEKNNSGAVFFNKRKTSQNHPDYTGSATLNGNEYWVSAWEKQDKSGKPFYSLAFTLKQAAAPTVHETAKSNGFVDDGFGDDVPF